MFDLNRLLRARSSRPAVDFNAMLNWKLLRGSHEFPGPDGGTCINEAAIVAAGYPYRSVQSVDDCPSSFSRPMSLFAMCLNDALDDELRQEVADARSSRASRARRTRRASNSNVRSC